MQTTATDPRAAYRKYRGDRHEAQARTAATLLCNPRLPNSLDLCRIRRCRRDYLCSGAMRPCTQLLEKQQALQRLGFDTDRAIDLPVCLVELADQDFALVEQSLETAAETMGNEPSWGWVQQAAAIRFLLRHGWFTRALAESEPLTDL